MVAFAWLPSVAFSQAAETEDVQVLSRGPGHKTLAESVSFQPAVGIVVSATPPELIEEIPPAGLSMGAAAS